MRLSALQPLFERPGPWASVYLDATGSVVKARRLIALRWRDLRDRLADQGADEPTLRALDETIEDARPPAGPAGRAVFAARGVVGLDRTLPAPPPRDTADWSIRPHAAGLVRALGEEVRWIRADVDRTGGSVTTNDGTLHVSGLSTFPIAKVSAGGWSMPRYQRAAETNWDRNSGEVAATIASVADRTHPDVIVLSGDVRARQLVRDRLPARLVTAVAEIDHESPDPDRRDPGLDVATAAAIESAARARQDRVLERFHAGIAHGQSVRGLTRVTEAARERRVDTLLLAGDGARHDVWVDPDRPAMVAAAQEALAVPGAVREPAADALIAAAATSGADAVVIDGDAELADGLGAILRYPR